MKKYSPIFKEIYSTISLNISWYIVLIIVIFLSTFFSIGITISPYIMQNSMISFFDKYNYSDIQIMSKYGFTRDDLIQLKKSVPNIKQIEGKYYYEIVSSLEKEESNTNDVLAIYSYEKSDKVNKLKLLQGHNIRSETECIVDASMVGLGYKLGDTITLDNDIFINKKYTIVGFARSPRYISVDRGTSELLNGKIRYFIYIDKKNFIVDNDYYIVDIILEKKYKTFTKEYNNYLNNTKNKIEIESKKIINQNVKDIMLNNYNDENVYSNEKSSDITDYSMESYLQKILFFSSNKTINNLNAKWYISTRNENFGYNSYYEDTLRIKKLAFVFSFVYNIVLAFVLYTSISIIIKNDKYKIGILESLGYNRRKIFLKYFCYVISADIIGFVLGAIVGILLFPNVFSRIYYLLYFMPSLIYSFPIGIIILLLFFILFITLIILFLSQKNYNKKTPYSLYNDKNDTYYNSKKNLEKVINCLSANIKVHIRCVFSHIGRSIITTLSISCCVAMIIMSFGLREAIKKTITIQYKKIVNINSQLYFSNEMNEMDKKSNYINLKKDDDIKFLSLCRTEEIKINSKDKTYRVSVIVPKEEKDFQSQIFLKSVINNKKINLETTNGVVITKKLADLLELKIGSSLSFKDNDNNNYYAKIADISENYIFHYIFMNRFYYQELHNTPAKSNVLLVTYKNNNKSSLIDNELYKTGDYSHIVHSFDVEKEINNIVSRYDIVLIVFVISTVLLTYVIFLHYSQLNIYEKKNDIYNMKSLGYKNSHIYYYINGELFILELVGILLGIILGSIFINIIIRMCEIDIIMFYRGNLYKSYILGIMITIMYTIMIHFFLGTAIKKIIITNRFD